MKNPFKPERPAENRDNPVVPNVVERAADRAARHDNPLVPNAIERPVERAVGDDRGEVVRVARERAAGAPVVDRPFVDDGPGDRPGVMDHPSDIARGVTTRTTS